MMRIAHSAGSIAVAAALLLATPLTGAVQAQITTSTIKFARGGSSANVSGSLSGDQTRDYLVRANAGQTLRVTMTGPSIIYFNILPPGSSDEAIFVGSNEGNSFSGTLSAAGAYKIRVYQMRASARRGESGRFRLAVSVSGGAGAGSGGVRPGALGGIAGMSSIAAIDEMTTRGFANVDSFETGNTQYGIFYSRPSRVCAQLTMADGKVVDARDIRTHPKCR